MLVKPYNHLSKLEREEIKKLNLAGLSVRKIAKKLGRSVSTISRELSRNSSGNEYFAEFAHAEYLSRRVKDCKLDADAKLKNYVLEKLGLNWSPEQIAGRLRLQERKKYYCCHETIYRYIYSETGIKNELYNLLPQRQKRRKRWYTRRSKNHIPDRTSIHRRPEIINSRQEFGHWEADLVIFKGRPNENLLTMVERKSRFTLLQKNYHKTSWHTWHAMERAIHTLPQNSFKSITFDNGNEFAKHTRLKQKYDLQTFFCDRAASWQKGQIENTNKRIRRFLPKATDFKHVYHAKIQQIQDNLNNTPRKCLNYATPAENIAKHLTDYLKSTIT